NAPGPEKDLASLMPQGAQVYLESKDLNGLLQEWNASAEKASWMKSDNYEVFSRSRLLLRLSQAQQQFAAAAGVPPDYKFLGEVAGRQSALAIYNIGKLELLYITRLPSATAMNSAIWQQRSKFEPRQSAGRPFFVRTEAESGRVVAFAIDGDYLILGTREDLVAGALASLTGQKMSTLDQEPWYVDAVKAAKETGDLRMLVHLSEVAKTPQFRSYWIQQNITEMRRYESSISDLYRSAGEYREERALLLKDATPVSSDGTQSVAELARLVPADAGVFKCVAGPSVDEVLNTLEQKVLTPRLGPAPPDKIAPTVTLTSGKVGRASSLETRIDVPPPTGEENTARADEALKKLLSDADLRGMMQMHRSEVGADGVFVRIHSAVALAAANDWNEQEVLKAIRETIAPGLTADQLGVGWRIIGSGPQGYFEMDGLNTVAVALRGRTLIVATDGGTLAAVLARMGEKSSSEPATYIAGFRHDAERENFFRMTSVLDRGGQNQYGRSDSEPQFFSQNVGSLSRTLSGVKSESVIVRRVGATDLQTVRYQWR
ncbi:MAG TPA: hypothetical protein VFU86_09880, partial [Terriglobales bacterium]|nr:hypothetical protein [Terriglobales bacterium]